MLKRIRISGYKSLRDLDTGLAPLSVIFGPNAAGKSNFLDALQLLSRLATSRTLKEAFEPPYRGNPLESFAFPETGLKGLRDAQSAWACAASTAAPPPSSTSRTEVIRRAAARSTGRWRRKRRLPLPRVGGAFQGRRQP